MAEEKRPNPPSREELAGVYFRLEGEEKVTVRPPGEVKPSAPEHLKKLTREELAGITFHLEGEETIHPPRKQQPPSNP